jgi:hypothetical protein
VDHLRLQLTQSGDDGVVEQPERLSGEPTVLWLRGVLDQVGQLVEVLDVPYQPSLCRGMSEGLQRPVDPPEDLADRGELFQRRGRTGQDRAVDEVEHAQDAGSAIVLRDGHVVAPVEGQPHALHRQLRSDVLEMAHGGRLQCHHRLGFTGG